MSPLAVVHERLANQRLVGPRYARPADAVEWLGAVQAQDYRGSLWGVGLRTRAATELDVERAIAERAIVRTWPMRGTLHLVASKDVRWMLRHLAPRVLARSRGRHRQLELDEATFAKSGARLGRALEGGRALTRPEAFAELERAGIATSGQRGIHILGALAMQGLLCLGARRGRQPTFVLLDEWLPRSRALERDEALGELARRYFTSHGPATPVDFSWWSGLPLGEARRAVELAGKTLVKRGPAGDTWSATPPRTGARATVAHLLPPWDEFTVAYRDRAAFLEAAHAKRAGNGIFSVVTIDGRVAGTWRRQEKAGAVRVRVQLFEPPGAAVHGALERAVSRFARFVGLPGSLSLGAT
ncbi:MAG TPA: winged helix DNA-binding domain-containing protein [Polyangia bacterium]|jgi:hypothetical protein|nr:winged helix DNA-binding domain-containing protein [Polyangia bacterium]